MSFNSMLEDTIKEHGWAAVGTVDDKGLPFTYSIGLISKYNHPEILIVGIDQKMARALMGNVLEVLKEGRKAFRVGDESHEVIESNDGVDLKVKFAAVSDFVKKEFMCQAGYHYGKHFEALQMMLPDREGRFPEDLAYDYHSQLLCEKGVYYG